MIEFIPVFIAYVDPGSGGYLIGAVVTAAWGFMAFGAAVVIHFFRQNTWARWVLGALILAAMWLAYLQFFHRSITDDGGLIPVATATVGQSGA
jgi:hypothetical protein